MSHTIPTPRDFSFQQAVEAHGWRRLKPFEWDDATNTLTHIERIDTGDVVAISMRETANGIDVASRATPDLVVPLVRAMFQLDVDISEFHAFCSNHDKLAHVPEMRQGRILVSPTVWEDVVKVICTTNTTWSQTKGMVARIVDTWGEPLPGQPDRRAFPSPARIAALSLDEFANGAKLGYRNAAVHSLAVDIVEGRTDLEAFRKFSGDSLWKALLALRGVGPYAASCLMIYLGHFDRVNVDSWARMMVGKELDRSVSDKEVHEFFEPYGKWKALAYHYYPWKGEEPAY